MKAFLTWIEGLIYGMLPKRLKVLLWELKQKVNDILWAKQVYGADPPSVPDAPGEIRVFMVVRNESLRLPYLFEYYKKMGVDRFFVIDNDSDDGTAAFLREQEKTHVFHVKGSYRKSVCGNSWVRVLLNKHGRGYWCLVVDADELFAYPHYETMSIKELCEFLDQDGSTAVHSILLDMYSDKPVRLAEYKKGEDPLLTCSYFDEKTFYNNKKRWVPWISKTVVCGGMRQRVFGFKPALHKKSLFKYNQCVSLGGGQHSIGGVTLSAIKAAVLHFSYSADFIPKAFEETEREEHHAKAIEYKAYKEAFEKSPDSSLHYEGSVKFSGSKQLVDLGIMETSQKLEAFARSIEESSLEKNGI